MTSAEVILELIAALDALVAWDDGDGDINAVHEPMIFAREAIAKARKYMEETY